MGRSHKEESSFVNFANRIQPRINARSHYTPLNLHELASGGSLCHG